jgi:predicted amidohydrolase
MKEILSISLVQPELRWEDCPGNLDLLQKMIMDSCGDTDLILLPETFPTGFTMRSVEFAEEEGGAVVQWMVSMAREKQSYISGSLIYKENDLIFNRLYWISPDGVEGTYDKRHLFRMGREDRHFTPGKERKVFSLGSFRFLPQICYDLRFPVFARNRNDYDVLFYLANWPAPRHLVWETLLRARAIENQAYVIGVNRSGRDGEGVDHFGGSCVIDPLGKIERILDEGPGVLNCTIDLNRILEFREKFPVWRDADPFTLL